MNRRNFFFGLSALAAIKALPACRAATKAWVRFTGGVWVASPGVTIEDNGVGDYTINWTTAASTADYAVEIKRD